MYLSELFCQAMENFVDDLENQKSIKQYYINNLIKKKYIDSEVEMFFFNDRSLVLIKIKSQAAEAMCFAPDEVKDALKHVITDEVFKKMIGETDGTH